MTSTRNIRARARRRFRAACVAVGALAFVGQGIADAAEVALFEAWRDTGPYRVYAEGFGVANSGGSGTFENVGITGPAEKAYLYWIGANVPAADVSSDPMITFTREGVPGVAVTADDTYVVPFERPFAPGSYFWNANHTVFVADVTGLIAMGTFDYSVTDFSMDQEYGLGLQIVYRDDNAPITEVAIYQGHDFAFSGWNNGGELNRTDVVTHTFDAATFDRILEVTFFAGGGENTDRPDQLWMLTGAHTQRGGLPSELITNALGTVLDTNPLEADEFMEWDTVVHKILIPAGDTFAAFQFQSGGGTGLNTPDESFSWLSGTFAMRAIPEPGTLVLFGAGALMALRRRR